MTPAAAELLDELAARGVLLEVACAERLRVDAPAGVLTPELRQTLGEHKAELLELLQAPGATCIQCGGQVAPHLSYHCQGCAEAIYANARRCKVCGLPTAHRHALRCPACQERWRNPIPPELMPKPLEPARP